MLDFILGGLIEFIFGTIIEGILRLIKYVFGFLFRLIALVFRRRR